MEDVQEQVEKIVMEKRGDLGAMDFWGNSAKSYKVWWI